MTLSSYVNELKVHFDQSSRYSGTDGKSSFLVCFQWMKAHSKSTCMSLHSCMLCISFLVCLQDEGGVDGVEGEPRWCRWCWRGPISLPHDVLVGLVVLQGGLCPCLMMCWWGWRGGHILGL